MTSNCVSKPRKLKFSRKETNLESSSKEEKCKFGFLDWMFEYKHKWQTVVWIWHMRPSRPSSYPSFFALCLGRPPDSNPGNQSSLFFCFTLRLPPVFNQLVVCIFCLKGKDQYQLFVMFSKLVA